MLKRIDAFTKNVIIVFLGVSFANFLNLLYQLLIAHQLSAESFASFNSLLSIYSVITAPMVTLQVAVTKYCSEFSAQKQVNKVKFLLSDLLKKTSLLGISFFVLFFFIFPFITDKLNIQSVPSRYILSFLIASSWLVPVFAGGIQGLEFFGWMSSVSVVVGVLKLALTFLFLLLGYNIAGALGALLAANIILIIIYIFPLKNLISFKANREAIDYRGMFVYLFPVALSSFCFMSLVSIDMILVKYYFSSAESGNYALAQMLGKIFLFLPGAISLVMFPKTSGLNAKKMDTSATVRKSLLYVTGLCVFAYLFYSFFPEFVLKVLTGKAYPASVALGRLFGISMSFFALLYTTIFYFLSIKDLRFIKYLVTFTLLQALAIALFHNSLFSVQLVLCVNAVLLFFIHLILIFKK